MKKLFKISALGLALVLALAACGNQAQAPASDPGTSQTQAPAEAPKSDAQTQQEQKPQQGESAPPAEEQKPAEAPVEYLFDLPAEPLEGDLGGLTDFSAVYKGAVDGVQGEWKYQLTLLRDLYAPGEHLM